MLVDDHEAHVLFIYIGMVESVVSILQHIVQSCRVVIVYQLVTFTAMFYATNASAAEWTYVRADVGWLGLREFVGNKDIGFNIIIDDQVNDGCWATPQAARTAIELELKRSDIQVKPGLYGMGIDIVVSALGMQVGEGYCAVSYSLEVSRMVLDPHGAGGHQLMGFTSAPIWSKEGILGGPKADISVRLKNQYIEATQSFILAIDSMSKEVLAKVRAHAEGDAKLFWDAYRLE